jgi:hypothetical protein
MIINLKVEKYMYKFFSFLKFFYIYLEIHCQDYQNNPLSMDPRSLMRLLSKILTRAHIILNRNRSCNETKPNSLVSKGCYARSASNLLFLEIQLSFKKQILKDLANEKYSKQRIKGEIDIYYISLHSEQDIYICTSTTRFQNTSISISGLKVNISQ